MFYELRKTNPALWKSLNFLGRTKTFLKAFQPNPSAINKPIVVLLLFSLFSVLISQHRLVSFKGFIGKALENAFLYFSFIECINSKNRLKTFLTVFFLSATVVSTSGVYQYFVGHDFIFGHLNYDGRISSSFRSPNDFAAYLVFLIPILLSIIVFRFGEKRNEEEGICGLEMFFSNKGRIALSFLLILTLFCLVGTYSRGGLMAIVLALVLFGCRNRKIFLSTVLLVVVFFVVAGFLLNNSRGDLAAPGRLFNDNGRMYYWQEATNIIKHNLIFGTGLNTYSLVGREYKITWGGYPHNCYLQMAAETGVIGLIVFLWMITALFKDALRTLSKMTDFSLRFILLGALIGLAAFLIHCFWDTIFYSVILNCLMWIYFGLIVAVTKIQKPHPASLHG